MEPLSLDPYSQHFSGTGVYALYCIAQSGIYSKFHGVNRTAFSMPIYIGKAVPKGWRQARQLSSKMLKVTNYIIVSMNIATASLLQRVWKYRIFSAGL